MNKEQVRYYYDAVDAVTESLKHPESNKWAIDHAVTHEFKAVGFDEIVIYHCQEEVVIAINGSDGDLDEWVSNLTLFPITDDTHYDFRRVGILIYNAVKEIVDFTGVDNVTLVGFSRGGPLSQVASEYLSNEFKDVEFRCVTFGSPRVYTTHKKHLNYRHYRVYSIFDPVRFAVPYAILFIFPPYFKHKQSKKFKIKKRIKGKFSHKAYRELIRKYL